MIPSDQAYVYHATNMENAVSIASQGILTHKPWEFTDQEAWPDGSTEKRNYFIGSADNSLSFAPASGQAVVLRIPRASMKLKRESTGDFYTTSPVSPAAIEAWIGNSWVPVSQLVQEKRMGGFNIVDWVKNNCKFASKEDEESAKMEFAKQTAPWGVLYAKPNPDGSRKKCENCFMWVQGKDQCMIHKEAEHVTEHHVCGYHVYGTPMKEWKDQGIAHMEPKESGLVLTEDGSSCDLCKWYEHDKCYAVAGRDNSTGPVPVDDLGCCSRWVKK